MFTISCSNLLLHINLPFFLQLLVLCVVFLCHFSKFLFCLQFLVVIYYSNINLSFFFFNLLILCMVYNFLFHFMLSVNLQVLSYFSKFLFYLQFLVPIYYSTLIYPFFLQFTSPMCGSQIFLFHFSLNVSFQVIFHISKYLFL